MDKFEVGELAVICNVADPEYIAYNQTDCEIAGGLKRRLWKNQNRKVWCYQVRLCDGNFAVVSPRNLKKRPGDGKAPDARANGKETPFWSLISAPKRRSLAPT